MIRKAALLTLLTALLAPPGMAGAAVTARTEHAAAADPLVVEQITPGIVRDPAAPITISGTVTGTPLSSVRVQVDYLGQPFRQRSDMETFLRSDFFAGSRFFTKVQSTPLDQSGKLPFRFTMTPQELRMTQPGVYPIAIEAVDVATGQRLAVKRTFLPYVPAGQPVPKVKLALALPITDRPHRADDATFMDDDLRASVSSGRLAALLKVAQTAPADVTWFVDPAVLQDAGQASAGAYVVRKGTQSQRQNADPQAGQWLTALRTALTGKNVVAMPYADPDVTSMVHNGLEEPAVAAIQRGAALAGDLLGREVSAGTVWPADGLIDRDAADELAMSGVKSLLLSGDALPVPLPVPPGVTQDAEAQAGRSTAPDTTAGQGATTLATVADTPMTAFLSDPALGEILASDVSAPGAALLARQRFVSETAMLAFEQATAGGPSSATAASRQKSATVVVAPPSHLWNPDPAFVASLLQAAGKAPWLRTTPLTSVKPARGAAPKSDLAYGERERQAELSRAYMNGVRRLDQKSEAASTVTDPHSELFHEAILRLMSSAWRDDAKRAALFSKQVQGAIDHRLGLVSVINTPRAIAGANGQVPVSVANNLDKDVRLRVRVTSENTSRLEIDAPDGVFETEPTRVYAGRSQLVNVPVIVPVGGGEATIRIQVLTADRFDYGDPVRVVVRATGYTGIALVIVGAALGIMLAAVVMRVLRRRSRKSFPFGPSGGAGGTGGPNGSDGSGDDGAGAGAEAERTVPAERTKTPPA
ncbi:hypothetical protein JOL79_12635 [Microbispora sp. RL4-1S]|uniref:Secreted protein n=1 Tax=Microbispora oryzae TaxID=2806554 RepID=A0A940WPB2_9ACTN|nr:hypothetical protein [Microbispora oryzae]MBP2704661.1 hypothetical protein [Microbispora oryzae]